MSRVSTPPSAEISNTFPAIGTNLSRVEHWLTQYPFVDFNKSAEHWITNSSHRWDTRESHKLDLDDSGWIKSLPFDSDRADTVAFDQVTAIVPNAWRFKRYIVRYRGEGRIRYWGDGVRKDKSDSRPGRDVIYAPGSDDILLSIHSTDPQDVGDYLRDIQVIPEPFESVSGPFNPDFLAHLEGFRTIRFMNWMETNHSTQRYWQDRPRVTDSTFSDEGVPVETMVALANQTGTDPWFNMPHLATDNYIRRFAEYVKTHLDSRLNVYVEYSNEVWNESFEQFDYAVRAGSELFGDSVTIPKRIAFYAQRTSEIGRIWDEVFSEDTPEGAKGRVTGVLGAPSARPWVLEKALGYIDSLGVSYEEAGIDAVAIAPYFGAYLGAKENEKRVEAWTEASDGGLDTLFRELSEGGQVEHGPIEGALDQAYWRTQMTLDITEDAGLDLLAYEGGQHLVGLGSVVNNQVINKLFIAANRDPRMGDLYRQYLADWQTLGGDLFVNFSDVKAPSKWGSWGTKENLYQRNSPKWAAIQDVFLEDELLSRRASQTQPVKEDSLEVSSFSSENTSVEASVESLDLTYGSETGGERSSLGLASNESPEVWGLGNQGLASTPDGMDVSVLG